MTTKKKPYNFRFHETEVKKWRSDAKKSKLDLTAWIESRMNQTITEPQENQFEKL